MKKNRRKRLLRRLMKEFKRYGENTIYCALLIIEVMNEKFYRFTVAIKP